MSSSGYRSRLDTLELVVNNQRSPTWIKLDAIKYYAAIGVATLFILWFTPPSFVYVIKHKKRTKTIDWVKWVGLWIVVTGILCTMYYLYNKRSIL